MNFQTAEVYLIKGEGKRKHMDNFTNKVKIITEYDQEFHTLISQADLPDLAITEENSEANILLASPPKIASILDSFPQLEWVQSMYAGVDALTHSFQDPDYLLTNVKGIFGPQIAEYVLGYTIEHFRHWDLYRQQQSEKVWQPHRYRTINGKQMFIFGTGSIGNHLAKTAAAFGVHTIGVNRTGIPPKESAFNEVVHIEQVNEQLKRADIVVSTLPKTTATTGLFNQSIFEHCTKALFFNVGRGDAVVTEDLLAALDNGVIQHAYLDVFINEPISQQCPYWHHPSVTVTPHIAANSFPELVFEIFKQNYLLWRDGFQLNNRIDFDKGY